MQLGAPTQSVSTPLCHNLQRQPTHPTQKTVSRLSRILSFFLQGNLFCVFTFSISVCCSPDRDR